MPPVLPWLAWLSVVLWAWRADLFHSVPGYGDVLEGTWATAWYDQALRQGLNPGWYPLAFGPGGYFTITYAWGITNFLLLLPLSWLGGLAFASNAATLLTFLIAFGGTYLLARRFAGPLEATVAALLYTFWGFRWYSITGQLNVSLGSALLPWLLWSLDHTLAAPARPWAWCLLTGAIWAGAADSSLYFIWLGGVAVLAWLIGRLLAGGCSWRAGAARAALVALSAGLLTLPELVPFWLAGRAENASFFNLSEINTLGTSLNDLPIPSPLHPWLGPLTKAVYTGQTGESESVNLGTLCCLVALLGIFRARRSRAWLPALILALVGLSLALGPTLQVNNQVLQMAWWQPVNAWLWGLGHRLKPALFGDALPPAPFQNAIPLPSLWLLAVVPFFERARVLARYALPGGLALFLLCALGLSRLRPPAARLALAALLVFEVLPPPTADFPFPPPAHPAFAWLRAQPISPDGIMEAYAGDNYTLSQPVGGKMIWATLLHGQRTLTGPNGVWPARYTYMNTWLATHPHPFAEPDFIPLLHFYRVRYVVLHLYGRWSSEMLDEAGLNPELGAPHCFPPAPEPPWTYPICALEVRPSAAPNFNLLMREGWSGPESWGRWIDGQEAHAQWVATAPVAQRIAWQAFPICVPGRPQEMWLAVNGHVLADQRWQDCAPAKGTLVVPRELARVGPNDLTVRTAFATPPAQAGEPNNPDPRRLSAGFTALQVDLNP